MRLSTIPISMGITNKASLDEEEELETVSEEVDDLNLVSEDGSEDSYGPTLDEIIDNEDFENNRRVADHSCFEVKCAQIQNFRSD